MMVDRPPTAPYPPVITSPGVTVCGSVSVTDVAVASGTKARCTGTQLVRLTGASPKATPHAVLLFAPNTSWFELPAVDVILFQVYVMLAASLMPAVQPAPVVIVPWSITYDHRSTSLLIVWNGEV